MSKPTCDCGRPAVMKSGACLRCAKLERHPARAPSAPGSTVGAKHPGEIKYKAWATREAKRHGLELGSFYFYIYRNWLQLPANVIRRGPTGRAIAVIDPTAKSVWLRPPQKSIPGEIPMKNWIAQMASQLAITERALWMKLYRGQHPMPNVRRSPNGRAIAVIL